MFDTCQLPEHADDTAPDGSEVRVLLRLAGGGMAHFRLPGGRTSIAVHHRSVEEIWYVVAGQGELWRQRGPLESIQPLTAGVCVSIPLGTRFQFRALGDAPLDIIGMTVPPWPGADEAVPGPGRWEPNPGPGAPTPERPV